MDERIQELTQKIEDDATADLYWRRAVQYHKIGDFESAVRDCNEGLILNEKHRNCYCRRIDSLTRLKRFEEALDLCNESIQNDEAFAPAYWGRGLIYSRMGENSKAVEEYTAAIDIDPDWADPYNSRGEVHRREKRDDDAMEDYAMAIKLNPDFAFPYSNRGLLYKRKGENDKALADFEEAIRIDPSFATPFYARGLINDSKESDEKVLADFTRAFELWEKNDDYLASKAKVKKEEIEVRIQNRKKRNGKAGKIIDETEEFFKAIEDAKEHQAKFTSHTHEVEPIDTLEFTVLRKWNSYTPIIASKGGGYFLKIGKKGIVIDPGFNFIENFMAEKHKFNEIDAILITHAHNDHTADLDSLLTLLHKYNNDLLGGDLNDPNDKYKEDSLIDSALKYFKHLEGTIHSNPQKMKEVKKKVDKDFKKAKKVITFYITSGTFKKYAGFFNLMKKSNYKIVCVDMDTVFEHEDTDGLRIRPIKAKHDDVISDATAVGFCFEKDDFVLIYTGDTGFWGMDKYYEDLTAEYQGKRIVLIANLGGFKRSENSYSREDEDSPDEEVVEKAGKRYYKNHLGRLGVARLAEIVKPELCILSEFGEEFDGYRIKLAEIFDDVFQSTDKKVRQKTKFLPADVGLCVNGKLKVRAIVGMDTDDHGTAFKYDFIDPDRVLAGEVEQAKALYYYEDSKTLDPIALAKRKVAEFYESLR
ncbi:MAG: tetratricopeptide repeat protein [Oscillospiraceae bacterium]|nr:tetratricopeptide repeat protein [Oscillospiraceae bacterium]